MPVLASGPMIKEDIPATIQPFKAHGMDLSIAGGQANGDCPFCGREGKFTVQVDTGVWRCLVCAATGNPLTFLRTLWERSDLVNSSAAATELAADRGYLNHSTLTAWGATPSIIDGTWLVPGYSIHEGKPRLDQLYRRKRMPSKGGWSWRLLLTPGIWPEGKAHALHTASMEWEPNHPRLLIFEGPWDGMAFWESARQAKAMGTGAISLELTGNPAASIIADANIIAVPGCNVWRSEWTELCRGKIVTIFFDNDHPKEHPEGSGNHTMAARDGVRRIVGHIAKAAREVHWLQWGGGGYDASLPTGFDVRDHLTKQQEGN